MEQFRESKHQRIHRRKLEPKQRSHLRRLEQSKQIRKLKLAKRCYHLDQLGQTKKQTRKLIQLGQTRKRKQMSWKMSWMSWKMRRLKEQSRMGWIEMVSS
jgi:hypothetical protein